MYMDTMIMPVSGQYRYIVQGRCSLSHYPEFRCLRKETARTLGEWIFEDILCRWGSLVEIVTDNGSAFVAAINYLSKKYHINHIRISGYNSRANGLPKDHTSMSIKDCLRRLMVIKRSGVKTPIQYFGRTE